MIAFPEYDGVMPFKNGLALTIHKVKFSMFDSTGKVVVPVNYNEINEFAEGLAPFRMNADTFGVEVIPAKYDPNGKFP